MSPRLRFPQVRQSDSRDAVANREGKEREAAGFQGGSKLFSGIVSAVRRGIVVVTRHSSLIQRERNAGSTTHQARQIEYLEPYGAKADGVKVHYLDMTESAAGERNRAGLDELIQLVDQGEAGVIAFAFADRAARHVPDAERLYNSCAAARALIMIDGQFYDPSDANQRVFLQLHAALAEWENRHRTLRLLTARASKARQLRLSISLPSPWVWASPEDEDYQAAVAAAVERGEVGADALAACSTPAALRDHKTAVQRNGRTLFVLPYPDAKVHRCVGLLVRWLIEDGSVGAVLRRIEQDPEWPEPGRWPVIRGSIYCADLPVEWIPMGSGRKDGKVDLSRSTLYQWFSSPIHYGIYAYTPHKLLPTTPGERSLYDVVFEPGAVPMDGRSEDTYGAVLERLRNPDRAWLPRRHSAVQRHAIPLMRCAHRLPDGSQCGLRIRPSYLPNGRYSYFNAKCAERGHAGGYSSAVDDAVLAIVADAIHPDVTRQALSLIRAREETAAAVVARARKEVTNCRRRLDFAEQQMERWHGHGDRRELGKWTKRADQRRAELYTVERELARAEREAGDVQALTAEEFNIVLNLGARFGELVERARKADPNALRALMSALVRAVHIHHYGWGVYWVDVEFPTGVRVGRPAFISTVAATDVERLVVRTHLEPWADPERRAAEPNAAAKAAEAVAVALSAAAGPIHPCATPWSERRVWAVLAQAIWPAGQHSCETEDKSTDPAAAPCTGTRHGPQEDAIGLARRLGVSASELLRPLLSGALGPAVILPQVPGLRDDIEPAGGLPAMLSAIAVSPSQAELHAALPEVARAAVAKEQGWAMDDAVTHTTLAAERGFSPRQMASVARRAGAPEATDAAGRRYTIRSALARPMPSEPFRRTLAKAPPDLRSLSLDGWLLETDATRVARRAGCPDVVARAPSLRVAVPGGRISVYRWLDPAVRRVSPLTLEAAVAALGRPDVTASDFLYHASAMSLIADTLGKDDAPTAEDWKVAVREGRIVQVRALAKPGASRASSFTFVPLWVRGRRHRKVARAWFTGACGHGFDVKPPASPHRAAPRSHRNRRGTA